MEGVFNQIKGTLHEHMVMAAENSDGDQWIAQMHDDPYHPSTDLIYTNTDTNEMFEVSLKATNSSHYVESALARYPDDPVMVTKEVAEDFEGDARVYSSEIGIDDLNAVTEENFDELLDQAEPTGGNVAGGIFVGVSLAAVASLWPYFIAWQRKRITQEEFKKACIKILGRSTGRLVPKMCIGFIIGPVYGWYALARGIFAASNAAHAAAEE